MRIDNSNKNYKVVTAESGCYLFNGETFSEQIFAPHSLNLSNWEEVSNEYKEQYERNTLPIDTHVK